MKALKKVAWVFVAIGGLNWGLVGLREGWNVVEFILGGVTWLEKTIYILIGLSTFLLIFAGKCTCAMDEEKEEGPEMEVQSEPEVQPKG